MQSMAPAQRAAYAHAVSGSIDYIFVVAAAVAAFGFLLSWLLEERALRESVAATGVSEAFAPPLPDDPHFEIERAIFLLSSRETQRKLIERIAARAGVDLDALSCWVLVRISTDPRATTRDLATRSRVDESRIAAAMQTLHARGLVISSEAGRELTPAGSDICKLLFTARREQLSELLRNFRPEQHAELAAFITKIAQQVVDDAPAT
jgi:DNA-binding MarR family transcriptional regulator